MDSSLETATEEKLAIMSARDRSPRTFVKEAPPARPETDAVGSAGLDAFSPLTPKQAADYANVSEGLIYLWCKTKVLPHYRFGGEGKRGKIVIDLADLQKFIACSKVEADLYKRPAPALKHIKLSS